MVTWSELLETWSWRYLAASYDRMTGVARGQSHAAISSHPPHLSTELSLSLSLSTLYGVYYVVYQISSLQAAPVQTALYILDNV